MVCFLNKHTPNTNKSWQSKTVNLLSSSMVSCSNHIFQHTTKRNGEPSPKSPGLKKQSPVVKSCDHLHFPLCVRKNCERNAAKTEFSLWSRSSKSHRFRLCASDPRPIFLSMIRMIVMMVIYRKLLYFE